MKLTVEIEIPEWAVFDGPTLTAVVKLLYPGLENAAIRAVNAAQGTQFMHYIDGGVGVHEDYRAAQAILVAELLLRRPVFLAYFKERCEKLWDVLDDERRVWYTEIKERMGVRW